jgi:hypothetical protein
MLKNVSSFEIKKWTAGISLLLLLLFPGVASAQAVVTAWGGVLSKADALIIFDMTRDVWNSSVIQEVAMGAARLTGKQETGLEMHTVSSTKTVTIKPDYRTPDQPKYIMVTVRYTEKDIPRLVSRMRNAISATQNELAPEMEVIGNVENIDEEIALVFAVYRKEN